MSGRIERPEYERVKAIMEEATGGGMHEAHAARQYLNGWDAGREAGRAEAQRHLPIRRDLRHARGLEPKRARRRRRRWQHAQQRHYHQQQRQPGEGAQGEGSIYVAGVVVRAGVPERELAGAVVQAVRDVIAQRQRWGEESA